MKIFQSSIGVLTVITSIISIEGRILFPFELEVLAREGFSSVTFTQNQTPTVEQESENAPTTEENPSTAKSSEKENTAMCPDDAIWCDSPDNYPDIEILKAVNKQKKTFQDIFDDKSAVTLNSRTTPSSNYTSLIETRISGFEDGEDDGDYYGEGDEEVYENICDMKTSYIKPRAAKNKEGNYRFIVNNPDGAEEYVQLVRVGTCGSEGSQCAGGRIDSPISGIKTKCKQEFSDHKLVTLSESGEELVVDVFSFPSCCTCLINSNQDYF